MADPPQFGYDSNQWGNLYWVVRIGHTLGAPYKAIQAALCAGLGENDAHTDGCNSQGYCGFWQVGRSWQRQHDYRDVGYWTHWAYLHGFYNRGGLISLANGNPNNSAGWIANQCQGAYADPNIGARYYDQYQVRANQLYNYWWPRVTGGDGGGGGGGGGGGSPYVQLAPTVSGITRVDDGIDMTLTQAAVAIGKGVVAWRDDNQWLPWGSFMALRLDEGPRRGWFYYIAEGIMPVRHIGDAVNAGDVIAQRARNGGNGIIGNIEAGWAGFHDHAKTLAQASGHGGEVPSPEGADFRNFYQAIPQGGDGGDPRPVVSSADIFALITQYDWSAEIDVAWRDLDREATKGYGYSQQARREIMGIHLFNTLGGR